MPRLFPPSLPPETARPLLAAAHHVFKRAPWEFMSDLELIGLRDDATGDLYVASILGTLGTMFAVVIYRNETGLRSIQNIVETREPSPRAFEELDALKVEWCVKSELQKNDLDTLKAAGFRPQGRGEVWPRFQSWQPGWYPWGVTESEAAILTQLLWKVARFVHLRESSGILHREPLETSVPIIPAGEETTLRVEDIEWVPFTIPPRPKPNPVVISPQKAEELARLPQRSGFVAEMIAQLVPELSFIDEAVGRPCLARVPFIVDRRSRFLFSSSIAHGAKPLNEAVGPALIGALRKAKARPKALHVDDSHLAATLRPACETIGINVLERPLQVAHEAFAEFEAYFQTMPPR